MAQATQGSHSSGNPGLRTQDLAGKVAVITGISKGIGRAIAVNLASRGCHILGTCTGTHSLPHVDALRQEIETLYQNPKELSAEDHRPAPTISAVTLQLDDPDAPRFIADALEQSYNARVDIFVNNAALVERTPVGGLDAQAVAKMCMGNIQTPAMIVDELVGRRYFQPQSRIVFVSSAESTRCEPDA